MGNTNKFIRILLLYIVCWQAAYTLYFHDFDLSLSLELLYLSWTFQSLEKGVFVWAVSLVIFVAALALFYLARLISRRYKNAA